MYFQVILHANCQISNDIHKNLNLINNVEDIVFFMGVNVFISVKYICYIYLVIIDRMEEKMDIFEFTVPLSIFLQVHNF